MSGCKNEITQQEALSIAQDFVNQNVKFYTAEDERANVLQKASITVLGVYKNNDEWNIRVHITSNATGEVKKSGLVVVVDAKTGQIKKEKLSSFVI